MALKTAATGQPLTEKELGILDDGYRLFEMFNRKNTPFHMAAVLGRQIAMIQDPGQDSPGTPEAEKAAQLHTLRSTIVNCIADQMDNVPEAIIRPERPDNQGMAESLTDIVGYISDINRVDAQHRDRVEDFFATGTSVTEVVWDEDMRFGKGDIAIVNVPIENMEWDSQAANIQDARAVFKKSWHPRQYFGQHYPDAYEYITDDSYTPASGEHLGDTEDESILLLEYWYRVYDAKTRRYRIHVAYLAGGALLYYSEKAHPKGIYKHGLYPFSFAAYTRIPGIPVGQGMSIEFAPMQRAINRYAQYIDENARASAKMRVLVNSSSGISEEDLADWNKQIIRGDVINDSAVRWFQSNPLSAQVNNQMNAFMDMIKLDSGQNQFSRGEGGLGVTAGNAIMALQEAGGKTTRFRTAVLKESWEEVVTQVLWLVRQYYTSDRELMITGRDGNLKPINANTKNFFDGDGMPYSVRIQIQRKNPMVVQQENEMIIQMFNILAQSSAPLDPLTMIKTLQISGKERLLAALAEQQESQVTVLQNALQEQQMQTEQVAGEATQRIQEMQGMLQEQAAALSTQKVDAQF